MGETARQTDRMKAARNEMRPLMGGLHTNNAQFEQCHISYDITR